MSGDASESLWVEKIRPENKPMLDLQGEIIGANHEKKSHSSEGEVAQQIAHLQAANQRLRELARTALALEETERARIARELHDETGQGVIALKLILEALRASLQADKEPLDPTYLHQQLTEMIALTSQTMAQIAHLVHHLWPKVLDSFSLNQVLEGVCEDFSTRTQRKVTYEGVEIPDLPGILVHTLYDFLKAILTYLEKLPDFAQGRVVLRKAGPVISLLVEDGRNTMSPDAFSVNLQGVEERIELFGGVVEKNYTVARGHCITAYLPFK